MEGYGIFYFNNGNRYDGEGKNSKKDGKARFYFNDGKIIYDGYYKDGVRHGKGTWYYSDGDSRQAKYNMGNKIEWRLINFQTDEIHNTLNYTTYLFITWHD